MEGEFNDIICCGQLLIVNLEIKGRQEDIGKFLKSITERKEFILTENLGLEITFICDKCKRKYRINLMSFPD